ncbi:MAG: polysaccharide biosynthesis protein, partial [Actinobacteria bacterium]|nr:polysaccharide biosynthesis protein [Actinomycetota bacterium]
CVVVALAAPALERFLRLDGPWAALLVGGWLLPATVVFAAQGLLQGRERFLALSAVLVLAAAARPLGGAVEAVTGTGVTALMGFVAAGTAVAALVALRLVDEPLHLSGPAARAAAARLRGPLAGAAVTTAGLLTLANVDLLLARHVLDPAASGSYAVGALFAKGAFWAPQFVSTLLYPRMAQPGRRARAVVGAVGICTAVGAGAVGVTLALGGPLVTLVAGAAYRPLGPSLWLFAALGGALAVAQVLLYARLAVGDRTIGAAAWLCIAGLAVAVLLDPAPTVAGVAARALAATLVLVGIGLVVERAAFRRGGDHAPAVTGG